MFSSQRHPTKQQIQFFDSEAQLQSYFKKSRLQWKIQKKCVQNAKYIDVICQDCHTYFRWLYSDDNLSSCLQIVEYPIKHEHNNLQSVHSQDHSQKQLSQNNHRYQINSYKKYRNPLIKTKKIGKQLNQLLWTTKRLKKSTINILGKHPKQTKKLCKQIIQKNGNQNKQQIYAHIQELQNTYKHDNILLHSQTYIRQLSEKYRLSFGRCLDYLQMYYKLRSQQDQQQNVTNKRNSSRLSLKQQMFQKQQQQQQKYNDVQNSQQIVGQQESDSNMIYEQQSQKQPIKIQKATQNKKEEKVCKKQTKIVDKGKKQKKQKQYKQYKSQQQSINIGKEDYEKIRKIKYSQNKNQGLLEDFDVLKYLSVFKAKKHSTS